MGRHLAALLPAIFFTGCLQSSVLMKVNADGSGTLESQTLMTAAALAQMRQLTGLFGGANAKPADPFSEEQMRQLAGQMGEGVTLMSTAPLKTADAEGRAAVYGFRDVTKLRVSETPAAPGNTSVRAGGLNLGGGQGGTVTTDFTRAPDGNILLTLHTPADPLSGITERMRSINGRGAPSADELMMVRQMVAGMRIALRVEPAGRLIRSSSPYVDGQTVTIFDVDVDALLKDDATFARLQNAKTPAEAAEALKGVPGVKLNLMPDITIEFAP